MPGTPSFGSPPGSPSPGGGTGETCEPSPTFGGSHDAGMPDIRLLPPRPPCSTPRRTGTLSNPEPEVVDELASALPNDAVGGTSPGGTQKYRFISGIGQGSFGSVHVAEARDGRKVAIKSVEHDEGREMREVEILEAIDHPNVVALLESFTAPDRDGKKTLHIVMEYLPKNLHEHIAGKPVDVSSLRCWSFQLLRACMALDALHICHRDVKPENVLLDPVQRVLKLCDFGSAKRLSIGSASTPYICARWWRAPELVLGSTMYRTSVDWWSCGCVLAEMMRGKPIFAGQTSWDQIGEISKALGPPTDDDVRELVPEGLAPQVAEDLRRLRATAGPRKSWEELLPQYAASREVIDLPRRLLVYNPAARLHPARSLCCEFFAKLAAEAAQLPPFLFQFSQQELSSMEAGVASELLGFSQRALESSPSGDMSFSLG
mmetsp:Transcript_55117/g.131345  ORF Transcript_55117/g.131345 Transcript_55117/m.131345 type:complete len:432 (+) Transcript_55117:133-1428(+)